MTQTFPDLPISRRRSVVEWFVVLCFLGVAVVVPAGLLVDRPGDAARRPAPTADLDAILDGSYASRFEAWVSERVPSLRSMQSVALSARWMMGLEPAGPLRWTASDWCFLERTLVPPDDRFREDRGLVLGRLRDRLERSGCALTVCIAPNKAQVFPEYSGLAEDDIADWDRFKDRIVQELEAVGIRVVDPLDEFRLRRDEVSAVPLYARTDSHWNPRGSAIAVRRLFEAIGPERLPRSEREILLGWSTPVPAVTDGGQMLIGKDNESRFRTWMEERRAFAWSVLIDRDRATSGLAATAPGAPIALCGDSFCSALAPVFVGSCPSDVDFATIVNGLPPFAILDQVLERVESGRLAAREIVLVSNLRMFTYDPFGAEVIAR